MDFPKMHHMLRFSSWKLYRPYKCVHNHSFNQFPHITPSPVVITFDRSILNVSIKDTRIEYNNELEYVSSDSFIVRHMCQDAKKREALVIYKLGMLGGEECLMTDLNFMMDSESLPFGKFFLASFIRVRNDYFSRATSSARTNVFSYKDSMGCLPV